MDTSKDYYESVIRNFQTYSRGRSLEQFCRDEAVDCSTHTITRSQLMLLLTGAVIRTIRIN